MTTPSNQYQYNTSMSSKNAWMSPQPMTTVNLKLIGPPTHTFCYQKQPPKIASRKPILPLFPFNLSPLSLTASPFNGTYQYHLHCLHQMRPTVLTEISDFHLYTLHGDAGVFLMLLLDLSFLILPTIVLHWQMVLRGQNISTLYSECSNHLERKSTKLRIQWK